jgi:hypothetical protein
MKMDMLDYVMPLIEACEPAFPDNHRKKHIVRLTKPLIGYKKVTTRSCWSGTRRTIVTLEIPVGALVVTSDMTHAWRFPAKFRTDIAKVVAFGDKQAPMGWSEHDPDFEYYVGDIVMPRRPFVHANNHCSSGIHFFLTYSGARIY